MSTWMWMYTQIHLHTLLKPPLGNSLGRSEAHHDTIPRANQKTKGEWSPKGSGAAPLEPKGDQIKAFGRPKIRPRLEANFLLGYMFLLWCLRDCNYNGLDSVIYIP